MRSALYFSAIAAALLITGSARAADLPSAPPTAPAAVQFVRPSAPFNWTGVYFGGNAGYGWASATGDTTFTSPLGLTFTSAGSSNANGAIAGGQVGANAQLGMIVFGLEGDWDWSGQKETYTQGCGVGCTLTGAGQIKSIATARGRVGVAFNRFLVYGTGGAAWLDVSSSITGSAFGLSAVLASADNTELGWTAGGGIEYAVTDYVSLRGEYLYISADRSNATGTVSPLLGGGTITETGRVNDSIVRAGINVRLPLGR